MAMTETTYTPKSPGHMTKKHFEELKLLLRETDPPLGSPTASRQWRIMREAIILMCKASNPNFDSLYFRRNCGAPRAISGDEE